MIKLLCLQNSHFFFQYHCDSLSKFYDISCKELERRRSRAVRVAWLLCRKSPLGCEFEVMFRYAKTGKLCLSTQQYMGTLFKLGKDKAAKGEG